jgi:uncharacterized protein
VVRLDVEMILILLILLIGSFIQGVSGFGLGLISMSFLPLLLPLKDSTLIVLSATAVISLRIVIKYRCYIKWKAIFNVLLFAILGRVSSYFVLNQFGDLLVMKKILGFVLLCFVFLLLKQEKKEITTSINHIVSSGIIGYLGGLIGGTFAVGGPIFVLYLLLRFPNKTEYTVNLQTIFLLTNLFSIGLHGINGDFNYQLIQIVVFGVIPVLIGVQAGLYWFEKLPNQLIKKLASYIVLLASLNLIFF